MIESVCKQIFIEKWMQRTFWIDVVDDKREYKIERKKFLKISLDVNWMNNGIKSK